VKYINLHVGSGGKGYCLKGALLREADAIRERVGDYNFCRIHRTIGLTPAMDAGIVDYIWDLTELLA
jgi:hypothetical protein